MTTVLMDFFETEVQADLDLSKPLRLERGKVNACY
jgi:hypothetical protein